MDSAKRQSTREQAIAQAVSRHNQQLMRCYDELEAFVRELAHERRQPIEHASTLSHLDPLASDNERELQAWLRTQLDVTRQMSDAVQGLLCLARSHLAPLHVRQLDLSALCEALRVELALHP